MGAVFEKIVTYYDIRIIRLSLEALLSRMGKRRRFPDIEQDRDIQTREDKLGFCEKRFSRYLAMSGLVDIWTGELAKLREKGQAVWSSGSSPTNVGSSKVVPGEEGSLRLEDI
ncbi:hypothetical protein D5086_008922 [Populus alba]|uniref:Uncharacterized protein n=1 Tax=Populus alba TaxID=43335 RepID=A0ACC4CIC5_POPAL